MADSDARATWLRARKRSLGASEVAAAIGANPWKSPYALWAEKVGLVDPVDLSNDPRVRAGTYLEPIVAKWAADDLGLLLENPGKYKIQKTTRYPWLTCTLDRLIVGLKASPDGESGMVDALFTKHEDCRPLEAKTAGEHMIDDDHPDRWGDEPPVSVLIQVHAQLLVTGHKQALVAALIGGQQFRSYDVYADKKMAEIIATEGAAFWKRVETRNPPDIDGSKATTEVVKRMTRTVDPGKIIDLPADFVEKDAEIRRLRAEIKALEEKDASLTNALKVALGDAEIGLLPDGSLWSYREVEKKAYEVKASKTRQLRRLAPVKE